MQAAALVAARASAASSENGQVSQAARDVIFRDRGSRSEIAAAIVTPDGRPILMDDEVAPFGRDWLPKEGLPTRQVSPIDDRLLRGRGRDGRAYRYVVAPVKKGEALAVVATPFDLLTRNKTLWLMLALGLPAMMVLLCVGLVLFGVERFVLRWIRALQGAAAAYDGRKLSTRSGALKGAPYELTQLGDALDAMSERVEERSTELSAAVDDRDRLLRELHHRVKNNFQMIASLLALQRQEAPETLSAILRAPEDRVRAMAAAYKVAYASGEIGHVEVAALVRDVAVQARQAGGGRRFEVSADFPKDAGEVDLDRAVSLALLVAELLGAAASRLPGRGRDRERDRGRKARLDRLRPRTGLAAEAGPVAAPHRRLCGPARHRDRRTARRRRPHRRAACFRKAEDRHEAAGQGRGVSGAALRHV